MFRTSPTGSGMGGGLVGPVPRDIWILLGVILATFSLRFFATTQWLPQMLELTPAVWRLGFVWQVATYPFVGRGGGGLWFLIALLILLMFGRDVFQRLGRRGFWSTMLFGGVVAALIAVVVHLAWTALTGWEPRSEPFALMQGQTMVITLLIAAFATLYRDATILLFFVLPIKARWFLGLEILFGFLAFLPTRDLGGFAGICAGVAFTYVFLSGSGGVRELWLRAQEKWMRWRLAQMRRRRGLRVVKDEDRWVH